MFGLFKRKQATPHTVQPGSGEYRAYTTAHDREISSAQLLRETSAAAFFVQPPPANLIEVLRSPTPMRTKGVMRGIEFQQRWRAGHTPGERPLVTLLIDHSGSMKGPRALAAAVAADTLGEMLEHARIDFEILGFTTSSWRGGYSRQDWSRRGEPKNPGRLCDLLHVVYHDAGGRMDIPSWSRNLVVLLDPEMLKENVDGEALQWARNRADAFNPTSWVCIQISDGAPVDDATILANGGSKTNWYLLDHLKSVVRRLNDEPSTRLGCLCLDREVLVEYRTRRTIDLLESVPSALFELLEELVWPRTEDQALAQPTEIAK